RAVGRAGAALCGGCPARARGSARRRRGGKYRRRRQRRRDRDLLRSPVAARTHLDAAERHAGGLGGKRYRSGGHRCPETAGVDDDGAADDRGLGDRLRDPGRPLPLPPARHLLPARDRRHAHLRDGGTHMTVRAHDRASPPWARRMLAAIGSATVASAHRLLLYLSLAATVLVV